MKSHSQAWAEYKLKLERDGHEGGRIAIARIAHIRGWTDCLESLPTDAALAARDATITQQADAIRVLREACQHGRRALRIAVIAGLDDFGDSDASEIADNHVTVKAFSAALAATAPKEQSE